MEGIDFYGGNLYILDCGFLLGLGDELPHIAISLSNQSNRISKAMTG